MERDFTGYGDAWPRFEWPNGAKLALNIVIAYEEGAEHNPLDGDKGPEEISEIRWSGPAGLGGRNRSQEMVYEYGSRVGVWRLLSALDRYQVTASVFACALALERNEQVARAFAARQYDIVGHGYRWTSPLGLPEDEERAQLRRAITSLERTTGQHILGWFQRPPHSLDTRRIQAEEGLLYDTAAFGDDIPYFEEVAGRPFLIVPFAVDNTSDIGYWNRGMFTASHFEEYCRDTFDALYRESDETPRMMTVSVHSRILGRPGRIAGLERFLDHVKNHDGVWVAKRTDIATFWAERFGPPNLWNWPVAERMVRATDGETEPRLPNRPI